MTAPVLDLWAPLRTQAPDADDYTARHRRGTVRMPFADSMSREGDLVAAWVCCDPACGGVALSADLLRQAHDCCAGGDRGRHHAGSWWVHFRLPYHGEFTALWQPDGVA